MRKRIKRSCIYHAAQEPARCFMAMAEVLENKLRRGTITPEELGRLVEIRAERRIQQIKASPIGIDWTKDVRKKHPEQVEVILFGVFKRTVSWEEYEKHYKHLGF